MAKETTLARLEARLADAQQLMAIHSTLTGDGRGRRYDVDALNRSAVILAVAAWEAFVEDLAFRNAASLARRFKKAEDFPEEIREPLLVSLLGSTDFKNPTPAAREAVWRLAGHGWRSEFRAFAENKAKSLNTPNSDNIRKLFKCTLAIEDITASWSYRRWGAEVYRTKLDETLRLRHRIAHGTIGNETVGKTRAKDAIGLVSSLGHRSVAAVSNNFKRFDLQGRSAKLRPA